MQKKFGTIALGFLPLIVGVGVQLIIGMVAGMVASFYVGIQMGMQGEIDVTNLTELLFEVLASPLFNDLVTLAVMLVEVLVFSIWYFMLKPTKEFAPLKDSLHPRNILIILVCGVALQIACSMGLTLILPHFPTVMENYTILIESIVGGGSVLALLSTVILAPMAEEFMFRGLVLRQFKKAMPFWAANLLQALLFGIYHMNIVQGVYAFLLGIAFGFVSSRLRNIWTSVLLHAAVNGSGMFLDYIIPGEIEESVWAIFVLFILCAVISVVLLFLFRVPELPKPEPVYDNTMYPYGTPSSDPFYGQFYDNQTGSQSSDGRFYDNQTGSQSSDGRFYDNQTESQPSDERFYDNQTGSQSSDEQSPDNR